MTVSKIFACLALALLFQADGCNPATSTPKASPKPPVHRFENVSTVGAEGIALDTVTGQWCRTWDWMPRDPKAPRDGLSSLPTCESLFTYTQATDRY
jgi:hypothetical protein